jgi:cobalt-precorrin 5A hydrolase
MSRLAALGLGCRSDVAPQAVLRIVEAALAQAPAGTRLAGLHTSARKAAEPGLLHAAEALGLALRFHSDAALAAVAPRVVSRSARVERLTGVGSVAEAAALAGAGEGARLIVPKFSADGVSCALALIAEGEA